MSKLTRFSKIAYDFTSSPYHYIIKYDEKTIIKYIFSSNLNVERYKNKLASNRKYHNDSLSNRYKMNINLNLIADLKLYTGVEKRGFLLFLNEDMITCLENVELVGTTIRSRN